jgi:hypothetical protein
MTAPDAIVTRANRDLQAAQGRVTKLRGDLEAAEREAADIEAFLRTFRRYIDADLALKAESPRGEHGGNARQSVGKPGSRARVLVDTCIDMISEVGGPVEIGDLLERVFQRGLSIGGSDQKSNLAGYLSRDPRVYSRGRGIGWDLVENRKVASTSASDEGASRRTGEGTNDRSSITDPDLADLLG